MTIYQHEGLTTNAIIYLNKRCICLLFTLVAKSLKIASYLILVTMEDLHKLKTSETSQKTYTGILMIKTTIQNNLLDNDMVNITHDSLVISICTMI